MFAALRGLHPDALLERGLVFVLAASLGGLALALAGAFQPWLVLLLALLATAIYHARVAPTPPSPLGLRGWQVLAVLLLALLFRVPPYQYVLGGQDPGVYTNAATHLLRTGGVAVHDAEYDRLERTGGLAEYRRQNYVHPFVPGVYTGDGIHPILSFQFYHLFPVWMALAASVFGLGSGGLGLLLLSLVSILFFQRLAAEISGSRRIGFAAALLLAANPLHAFFSKFPVTEVPTLAFSTAAFCFLAMYAQAPPEQRQRRWLWLSALAMSCLFFTRISGFMYLPLVLAVSVLALACDPDRARTRALSAWSLAVVLAYLVSVVYGMVWSRTYSLDIYDDSFAPLLGLDWRNALIAIGLVIGLLWAAIWRARERPVVAALGRALGKLDRLMGPALLLLLPAAAYKAWQLGFTSHYQGNEVLEQFPGVVAAGWGSVAHSSLVVMAMYLGPLAFIALLLVAQARLSPTGRLLLFFVCGFFAYAALLNWVVPYQPYYARYLLSELVPYSLLLLCCALAWLGTGAARRLLVGALTVSAAGYLVLSGSQVGKQDDLGAMESVGALAAGVGDEDVILFDGLIVDGFEPQQVKTTLVYTFGRHVITIGTSSLTDYEFMSGVDRAYDRVLVLSSRGQLPPGYTELAPVRLWALGFERSSLPPHRLVPMMDTTLRVFQLDRLEFGPGFRRHFSLDSDPRVDSLMGERRPGRGIQALGRAGELLTGPALDLPAGRFRLVLFGTADGRSDAVLSLVDGGRGQVLAETAIGPQATPGGALAWLDVQLPSGGARRIDVRVRVGQGSRLMLSDYTLTRLP